MPLININKDETLAFHIIACVGGSNKAYTTSKDSKFPDQVKHRLSGFHLRWLGTLHCRDKEKS